MRFFPWPFPLLPRPEKLPRVLSQGLSLPAGAAVDRPVAQSLLSRALYRCKHVSLAAVAPADRRAALRSQLLAWAPFDRTTFRVALRGDEALAFAWDRDAVLALAQRPAAGAASPAPDEAMLLLPEGLMREPMAGEGLRLVACLEGVEAQQWHRGWPVASRWWPAVPAADEYLLWRRSIAAGVSPALAATSGVPSVQQVAWLRGPWLVMHSADELIGSWSRLERVAVGASMVGLAALSGAQAHHAWTARAEQQQLQLALVRANVDAGPVLAARDRAVALAREADALAAQLASAQPIEVLQHLSERLPAQGALLREFELAGRKLRVALELSPNLPRTTLVKDLQAGAWFSEVAETRDTSNRGWTTFEMGLASLRPPAAAPTTGAAAASPASSPPTAAPSAPAPVPRPTPPGSNG